MKLLNLQILRNKKIKDLSVEFKGAGLYIAYGPNETGKTTFLEASKSLMRAKELSPNPVTIGEANSITIGEYIDANNNVAEVTKNIDAVTGKVKFELKYNNMKSSKVGDITSIFKFNDMTAEKFIALSNTKDGKRKQLEYILEILTDEDREAFANLQSTKEDLYIKRTAANKLVKTLEASVEINTLTDEEIKNLNLKSKIEEFIDAATKKIANNDKLILEKENLEKSKNSFISVIESLNIESFSEGLQKEFKEIIIKIKKDYDDKIAEIKPANIKELADKVQRNKEGLKTIEKAAIKKELLKDYSYQLEKAKKDQADINDKMALNTESIETFFVDKDFPIPELIVKSLDEGLFIQTENGVLPFNEEQLSTSQIMFITLKIMYFVNKDLDIIYLGRLESFGKKKTQALIKFAKDYDIQIIADKVNEDDNAPFIIQVLFEDTEPETLLEIPTSNTSSEPKDIPSKIEKRKSEGKINDTKKVVKQKEVLTTEEKTDIENDILNSPELF